MLLFDDVIFCPEPITVKMETEANLKIRRLQYHKAVFAFRCTKKHSGL